MRMDVRMNWDEFNREIRADFPALQRVIDGHPVAFLDGPGGYQVPQAVIDAVVDYLVRTNANFDGVFTTSRETGEVIDNARKAFADFFHCDPEEVAFGANMTTLTFLLAQALVRELKAGDRVLITEIDHEGNRGPWEQLADRGIVVEEIRVDPETCTLDMHDFEEKLSRTPKIVSVNYAANAVGTINDVATIVSRSKAAGAFTMVDAVHYAAHGPIDVRALDCDFLACSIYKFFGPHLGALYARRELVERLKPLKIRPQHDEPPFPLETGTLNHEGIAGAAAAVDYVAACGQRFGTRFDPAGDRSDAGGRRDRILTALRVFEAYEMELTRYLIDELRAIDGVRIYGPPDGHPRTSTVSFTVGDYDAELVSRYLDSRGLMVWAGDFFASRLIERLGVAGRGGLVRIGIAPYNSRAELTRVIESLRDDAALAEFARQG